MKKILIKYHNLWTLPLAILIAVSQNHIAALLNRATMTPEKIMKIVPALVVFLLAVSFIEIYYIIQHPDSYQYAEINNKKNEGWKTCSEKEKFHYSFWQRLFYLAVFAIILFGM